MHIPQERFVSNLTCVSRKTFEAIRDNVGIAGSN